MLAPPPTLPLSPSLRSPALARADRAPACCYRCRTCAFTLCVHVAGCPPPHACAASACPFTPQAQSLGGFTFAFRDYVDAGVVHRMDTPPFGQLLSLVDPAAPHYASRLALLPKLAVVSSDDEFMQLDWTAHGWLQLPGETK